MYGGCCPEIKLSLLFYIDNEKQILESRRDVTFLSIFIYFISLQKRKVVTNE